MGRQPGPGNPLTLAIIEDLKGKGYSQAEIARMYGVSRQYVSWIKRYYNGRLTPAEQVLQHFPFKVPTEMGQTSPYRRLREHGQYVATWGIGMDKVTLGRLRGFYRKLTDQVLEFDPNIPPIPRVSSRGGWAYRPRRPEDGDLLIRVNEHTELTDEGRRIWRLPAVMP